MQAAYYFDSIEAIGQEAAWLAYYLGSLFDRGRWFGREDKLAAKRWWTLAATYGGMVEKQALRYLLEDMGEVEESKHWENLARKEKGSGNISLLPCIVQRSDERQSVDACHRWENLPLYASEVTEEMLQYDEKEDKVGEGVFATVYKAKLGEHIVAVKVQKAPINVSGKEHNKRIKAFYKELATIGRLNHAHIVKLLAYTRPEATEVMPILVMEYIQGGTLLSQLGGKENKPVERLLYPVRYQIALDIGEGLRYLHQQRLIHRDLKSENVLLCVQSGNKYFAKIADFGLSVVRRDGYGATVSSVYYHAGGTPNYMAPEMLTLYLKNSNGSYTDKVDIYSFAVILWELMSYKIPFVWCQGNVLTLFEQVVTNKVRESIPDGVPVAFAHTIERGWSQEPNDRPTIDTMLGWLSYGASLAGVDTKDIVADGQEAVAGIEVSLGEALVAGTDEENAKLANLHDDNPALLQSTDAASRTSAISAYGENNVNNTGVEVDRKRGEADLTQGQTTFSHLIEGSDNLTVSLPEFRLSNNQFSSFGSASGNSQSPNQSRLSKLCAEAEKVIKAGYAENENEREESLRMLQTNYQQECKETLTPQKESELCGQLDGWIDFIRTETLPKAEGKGREEKVKKEDKAEETVSILSFL